MRTGTPLGPLLTRLGRPSRRTLLRWGLACGATLVLRRAAAEGGSAKEPPATTLDPAAFRALDAACARILPDDPGPGAREAGVMRFIEAELQGSLRALRPALLGLASLLDQWSLRRGGKPFAELDPGSQDRVLGELSRGEIPAKGFPQREVFKLLHTLCLEGLLGDPVHGGNQGMVGWTALGVPTPHRRTRAEAAADGPDAAPRHRHPLPVVP